MNPGEWCHLKFNQFLLECFGIWPYQSEITKRRNYLVFATWNLSLVLPLIQALLEVSNWSVVLFFGTAASVIYLVGGLLLVTIMYTKPHRLTKLYEQIETDLNGIILEEEFSIMDQFCRRARTLIFIFTGMSILAVTTFMTFNFLPSLYSSAQDYAAVYTVYSNRWVIHESLRRLQILVHVILVASYTALAYIVNVSVYIFSVNHTCGMYAIVSYRLQKVMRVRMLDPNKKMTDSDELISVLVNIITKHRDAIESAHNVNRVFSRLFYFLLIGAQICLAILIGGLEFSFNIKSVHLALRALSMGAIVVVYIFSLNYGGEQIIEYSNRVFTTTYFVNWHLMTPKTRKILLMIILRSSKGDTLAGRIMTLSLRNFTTIMYISWSMGAVLLSTQKDV